MGMEIRQILFGFLLAGLFMFANMSFLVQLADNNGQTSILFDDAQTGLSFSELNESLSGADETGVGT